jgi:hypothetical protein
MLTGLRSYYNLGSPQYFFELLNSLNNEGNWTRRDIEQLFYNKIIDGRAIFDGCLPLAHHMEIISLEGDDKITLNAAFKEFLNSKKQMCDKFVEFLFLALKDDLNFHEIFSSNNISYDVIYHSIQISYSAFSLKFSNFKQLLLDFNIIKIHPTDTIKKFIINSRYKKLFDKTILPIIRKKRMGVDDFEKYMEQSQINGEEAEKFVLEYEKQRLDNKEGIDWVAEYSVAEGYDISSFITKDSKLNDCFIEVKSYFGSPYFFWSRNEIDVARIKGENYCLYLVDRKNMNEPEYCPMIIRNPYINILKNNKWLKQIEKYKISLK